MDPEARFRAVFDSAYAPLCRYARHRGLTGPDAEDLVAQTLEIAWRRIDDLPVAEPLPWLYAVAHNLWRNKTRTDRRRRDLLARFRPLPQPAACGDPAALDPDDDAVGGRRYLPASWEECYQDREFGAAGDQTEIRQLRYLGVGAVPELSFPPIGIQDPPSLLGCKITLTEQIRPVQMYDVVEFGLLWCCGGRT